MVPENPKPGVAGAGGAGACCAKPMAGAIVIATPTAINRMERGVMENRGNSEEWGTMLLTRPALPRLSQAAERCGNRVAPTSQTGHGVVTRTENGAVVIDPKDGNVVGTVT